MVIDECSIEEKKVIRKLICLLFRKYKIKGIATRITLVIKKKNDRLNISIIFNLFKM